MMHINIQNKSRMNEKDSSRNHSQIMSPDSAMAKADLKGQEKHIKQYFEDHIELKELNSKSKDFDDSDLEISQLSDFVT
jgi:hypothetical protein